MEMILIFFGIPLVFFGLTIIATSGKDNIFFISFMLVPLFLLLIHLLKLIGMFS